MEQRFIQDIEIRRQQLQASLDTAKSGAERNRLGQFATPNKLAIEISQFVNSIVGEHLHHIRFADPSIGTGSFFSAALNVFGPQRIGSAFGIELDTALCDIARNLWTDSGLEIMHGDFTRIVARESRPPGPNLLLANPPYVRHHHINREDKQRLQRLTCETTGVKINGLAGLYVYFLLLATAWMEHDGYAAWLIPSEFMDVNYGESLKRFLTDQVTLMRIHRFDPSNVQFDDALVSSVVLVFRNTPSPDNHAVEFTFGGTMAEPDVREPIDVRTLREARKWTVYPRHDNNDRHISIRGDGPTLADLFRVQRGIATGCNKFFILDRADALRRRLPGCYLRPILPSPRFLRSTVIETGTDGYPLIDPQLCVIDCDLHEHVVEERYPALWVYLQTAEALDIRGGYILTKRKPWYKQEQRDTTPFLCTYMGRGSKEQNPFRFILNYSRAIVTNLYLMLHPRNALASMLRCHPDRRANVFSLLEQTTGNELRGEGRVYGGGLHKIEPRELGRISAIQFIERWPELQESVVQQEHPTLFTV